MWFNQILSGLLLTTIALTTIAQEVSWDSKFFNPKPADGDVTLPMPCGGGMVFRKVFIPVNGEGPLADLRVDLGASDSPQSFAENTLARHVAGNFAADKGQEYLLIGKYEVSMLQYQTVMSEQCPDPSMKLRLPQASVSWFDAVTFSQRWTQWLLKNASKDLPEVNGEHSFIRLPTEVEWEYAARGGSMVSFADFRERVFPMPDGMSQYVWFAGSRSANGKAQLTGLLAPNPAGLHDILGNLDEITLEPFRLNHLDRLHGLVGGYVVRGGNYFTAEADIRSSYRKEIPHFAKDGPFLTKTTGFRVSVAAPVIGSMASLQAIEKAWQKLGKTAAEGSGAKSEQAIKQEEKSTSVSLGAIQGDPADEIDVLTEAVSNQQIRERLQRLGRLFRSTREEEEQQRKRAARASLRMGGVICQQIGRDGFYVDSLLERNQKFCSNDPNKPSLFTEKECKSRLQVQEEELQKLLASMDRYAQSVMEVARSYDPRELDTIGDGLLDELASNEVSKGLLQPVKVYRDQTISYANTWLVKRQEWADECKATFGQR